MTDFPDIWAKSPPPHASTDVRGEALTTHSLETHAKVRSVRARIGRLPAVPEWFWQAVALAALLHDFGKLDDGFQRSVRPNGPAWGQRHEVLSLAAVGLLLPKESFFRRWVSVLVVTHHRPLTMNIDTNARAILEPHVGEYAEPLGKRFVGTDEDQMNALLTWFHDRARDYGLLNEPVTLPSVTTNDLLPAVETLLHELHISDPEHDENPLAGSPGLAWVLGQGAITFADHLASAHLDLVTDHPLGDFPERIRSSTRLFEHQERADRPGLPHLLLRSATGSGKTEAALLRTAHAIAAIHTEHGGLPRVFYVLPYLASINAMADRLRTELGTDIGVLHSRAGVYHLNQPQEEDEVAGAAARALAAVGATKLHRERLRVTTPYQLLHAAFAGAADSSMLLDTANSVFIFDELHAYEPRRLGMFLAMMRLWARELHGRIIVLSATLPTRFNDLFLDTVGHDQADLVDGFTSSTPPAPPGPANRTPQPAQAPPRHRLHVAETHLTDPESLDRIAADLHSGVAVLVIANNVADATALYEGLRGHAPDFADAGKAAWLLHARFRHGDRTDVETQITRWFATATDDRAPRGGLLVATQAAEVSLNVDFDALHSSGAPPEPLIQRMGRVNRRGLRPPAPVWINTPHMDEPASNPRADRVYELFPTQHAWKSMLASDGQLITESDTQRWVDDLYSSAWGDKWEQDVRGYQHKFARDFLDFSKPFDDRSELKRDFFAQFDGFEAILAEDRDTYRDLLKTGPRAQGRLAASSLHIPLPQRQLRFAEFDRELGIHYVSGDYTPELGLTALYRDTSYQPGELI
ncbi:CRISPR-associated helicase Cas3' [Saccharopolyspora gregorii]|uniref:CRISPR-associated helicase/endonuclease Cas3 n=1 Tax=Saccharopolyspora gregorii TaxID=33914 RepID=A0ABP6RQE7_9PSEU